MGENDTAPSASSWRAGLRPYEAEAIERVFASWKAGRSRVLVSLPTGTGKTVVFARSPGAFRMKRRLLVLAHREELLEQAREKLQAANPSLEVGIERAGQRARDAQVVIGSVQSLRGKRLDALDPDQFRLVVVDEAHHAVAPTYGPREEPRVIYRSPDASVAVRWVDAQVRRQFSDALALLRTDARWRSQPATPAQLDLLRAKGLPAPARLTKGQASRMLSYTLPGTAKSGPGRDRADRPRDGRARGA